MGLDMRYLTIYQSNVLVSLFGLKHLRLKGVLLLEAKLNLASSDCFAQTHYFTRFLVPSRSFEPDPIGLTAFVSLPFADSAVRLLGDH